MRFAKAFLCSLMLGALAAPAVAGPFIIDGTDADDHGSATATANLDGWLYIQRGLENIAAGASLTNTAKTVAILGSSSTALAAPVSAITKSSALTSAGWTYQAVDGVAALTAFFNGTGAVNLSNVSVLYFDSGTNVTGGSTAAEQAVFTTFATAIDNFVGAGGGLFSHAQSYGWLSALVPGLTPVDYSDTGLTLTATGNSAFPGLTNSDLSAGPWHQYFTGLGSLPVLATGTGPTGAPVPVILGGSGGSITNPTVDVPEPSTWMSMILGFGLIGSFMRRRVGSLSARAI